MRARTGFASLSVQVAAALVAMVLAADAQVTLDAQAAFEGQYRTNSFVAIRVDVTSAESTKGRIEADFPDSQSRIVYAQAIELPEGARKRVTLYVRPSEYRSDARVRFVDDRGRSTDVRCPLTHNEVTAMLVYAIHDELSGYHFIRSIDTTKWPPPQNVPTGGMGAPPGSFEVPMAVAYTDTENMPDQWKGYDSARLVVLDSFSPSTLSTEQQNALREWVTQGGVLLVSGGENYERLREPWLADMLPVDVVASRGIESLSALQAKYGGVMSEATPMVSVCRTRPGAETLLSQDSLPLIVRGGYGVGTVIFFAFSTDRQPVRDWSGKEELFASVLLHSRDEAPRIAPGISESVVARGIAENESMSLPSFRVVGFFLLAYLIVLVPINYFVLKRLGRRELAWITTPAIVLVFTIIAYGMGMAMRGGEIVVHKGSVLELRSGSPNGSTTMFFSLFSPSKRDYSISFDQPDLALGSPKRYSSPWGGYEELEELSMTLLRDGSDSIDSVPINMWDQELFLARAPASIDGAVTSALRVTDGELVGTIHNGLSVPIEIGALVYPGGVIGLDALASASDVQVRAAVKTLSDEALPEGLGAALEDVGVQVPTHEHELAPSVAPMEVAASAVSGVSRLFADVMGAIEANSTVLSTSGLSTQDARVRRALVEACFREGQPVFSENEALLIGWVAIDPLAVHIKDARPEESGQTLAIIHLPIAARRSS